jgi:branched-chain amino acid aminotransferase
MVSFINNNFVPAEKAFLHVGDLAIQRGYGIFDFFKVVDGHPYFLDDYLDRFFNSAAKMRLSVPLQRKDLVEAIFALIKRNNLSSSGIKIILTGGYSADGYQPGDSNLVITQHELVLPAQEQVATGVKVITHEYVRDIPEVKTINYSMGIWLLEKVRKCDAFDVLYQKDGVISEFPRSNFFIVRSDNTIVTPSRNVLAGITRKNLLSISSGSLKVLESEVTISELSVAKEAFITSTTKRIIPVIQVDNITIGNGKPGATTQELLLRLIEVEKNDVLRNYRR